MSDLSYDEGDPEDYLRQNPGFERALFREWCIEVCRWREMIPPTLEEWAYLAENWHSGQAPLDAVIALQQRRST